MSDTVAATNAWCAGLPRCARRGLSEAERAELKQEADRLLAAGIVCAVAAPVVFCLMPFAGYLFPTLSQAPTWLAVLLMLLMTVGTALLAIRARHSLRRASALRQDIRHGLADRYEGDLPVDAESEPTFRQLLKQGLLTAEGRGPHSIEVLTYSRRVWRVNDRRAESWLSAACVEVAETPEFAGIAADWLDLEPTEEEVRTSQRDLSAPEIQELRRYSHRLTRRRLLPTVLFAAWATAGMWSGPFRAPGQGDLPQLLLTGLMGAVAFILYVALFRWFHLTYRLTRDAGIGRVVIVRVPIAPEEERGETEPEHRVLEFLPSSRGLWTSDGRPAPWRLSTEP